jgi:very-short-patch-repair endonuclease
MEAIDSDSDVQSGSTPSVSIKAEIAQFITFATHQCDVAVIANLVVLNPLERDLEDLTLHLVAEPKVLGEHTWRIDRLHARSEFPLRDRRVSIAGGLLDSLNERMRAEVILQLRQGETILAEARHPIVALARNEWGGANYMPELLAAFVTPNDPAVQRILKEASQILEASGKSGAIDGYQSKSRKRSWEIVAGLWAAVSRRGLTYAEPPASFGRHGQKIRLPSMIEEQGLATCLDTALLFAAAIEQAGLNPVVVFTEDHALTGAWLQPQSLRTLTVEDPIEIRKAIDQNELVLFETTMVTGGHAMPFSRALAEGRRQVLEANENAFVYAIDIKQARGRDIQPLSSLVRPATGVGGAGTNASRAAPPLDEAPDLPPFDIDTLIDETPQTPAERLERWKRSLLDLSKRNRLLNLKPSATAIPIFCPDAALLEDKIAERKRISLITPPERKSAAGEVDTALYHLRTGEDFAVKFATEALGRNEIVANVAPKELEKGVLELYRKAKADFEEGGSNTLFLALGMLRWAVPEDSKRSYRAPLILLPVKLERRSAASKPYLMAHEDEPVFNLTLLQMLRQDFDIEIPGLEGELPSDDSGINVRQIWETVRTRVREVPGFEVVDDIVLSTFSFAKYLMWTDLAERTEALKESPFVRHIIDTPRESYRDGAQFSDPRGIDWKITPSEIMAPLNADSSQIVAIHASGKSGDFVLEGPPGTGKSETIGNIIAHNLGLGHRVLFVSEKMAALEVVYRRLDACGLGDFCLELHSAKANKREVINKLGAAWEKRHEHPTEEWHRKAAQLADLRDQLNRLVEALHRPGPGGISPREAVGRSLRFGDVHRLRLDWERDETGGDRVTSPEVLASLVDLAKRVGQQFSQILPEDNEAFKDISHTDWSYGWAAEVVSEARKLKIAIEKLARRRDAFVDLVAIKDLGSRISEVTALGEIAALVPDCAAVNLRFALEPEGRDAMDTLEKLAALLEEYRAVRKEISSDYGDDHIASGQPLRAWLTQRSVVEAKIWPISIFARRGLRKAIRDGLGIDADHAPAPEGDLEALIRLAEIRTKIDAAVNSLPPNTPCPGLDADLELLHRTIRAGRHLREAVTKFASFGRELMETRALFIQLLCHERDRLEAGMPLAAAAADFVQACSNFNDCHSKFRNAAGNDVPKEEADLNLGSLSRRVDALVTREKRLSLWCAWVEISREAREAGLGTLVSALETGAVTHHHAPEAFKTAYACWLAPILIDARPELTRFSAVRHEDLIRTFRSLDEEFTKLTGDYIRAKLSAKVSGRDEESAQPGYGVLARELQKKMKHKPVRQLVSEMGETLTTLTPCLMMSPLSVAQFLPTNIQAFDLVVFDEASQITVPDAIGAIARGKRCVVVGDPQQMPPTSFFERGAEDDENEEVRDLESILDEALAARVPHHRLTGHYRSRHESLICFSNHAYYDGALVTYPSADTRETAVTFRQTDGVYAKGKARTNATEAKAVVAEIVRRLRDPELEHLSIGVVTLNAEQQRLIEDLLDHERRADPELERFFNSDIGDPVFVKNLETVQGDQRDVILLSIGYGPTEPGAKTMSMNFGPLNRQGGERRLNVAITRATTEVVVFTSFDASMIDLTRTSAKAVKDLKHYIDFAARGPIALGEAIRAVSTGDYDSDFEMAVAEQLRNLGWTVRTQIGVSKFRIDLGVVHPDAPGRFLAGVECDGATYHSSPSARDRDRVRHIILEQLGWRLFRVWSTDFFLDPETSIRALDEKLRSLLETDRNSVGDVHSGHSEGEDEPVDCPETKSQKEEVEKASGADYPDDMQVDETAFDVGVD